MSLKSLPVSHVSISEIIKTDCRCLHSSPCA